MDMVLLSAHNAGMSQHKMSGTHVSTCGQVVRLFSAVMPVI